MADKENFDYQTLKLNGIYQLNAEGDLMLRVKLPAGILSSVQAGILGDLAAKFGGGLLHLTSRGNAELYGLRVKQLPEVFRRLEAVGLITRGACGGAVRGVACGIEGPGSFARIQLLARRMQEHFTGNSRFEGLPKKFKIAVENGYQGARHLCQDLAVVYLGREGKRELCDIWTAGGLGRQPREAFLLANRVPVERVLPLVEGVIQVYHRHAPAGKRLKHLLEEIGETEFRALLAGETAGTVPCPLATSLDERFGEEIAPGSRGWVEVPVPAGQLRAEDLRQAAAVAGELGDGFLVVSREQNLLVSLNEGAAEDSLRKALQEAGLLRPEPALRCRVCPGSHACKKGLVPTRELACRLIGILGEKGRRMSWAVSGCPNSCTQPQLADYGIVGTRKAGEGKEARYDLLRREGEGFGQVVQSGMTAEELVSALRDIG